MKTKMTTFDGADAGEIELLDAIYGLEPRADILHTVVRWQLAKRQRGTHKTLTRSEINRTKRKMYKQKGTGSARHSSATVSQFRGGGRVMGPVVHSHAFDLPKKVRALGLRLALSSKAKSQKIFVLDEAKVGEAKTKSVAASLKKLGLTNALIVDGPDFDANFQRAARNLTNVDLLPARGINVYDILRRDTLVLTKSAIAEIEGRFA